MSVVIGTVSCSFLLAPFRHGRISTSKIRRRRSGEISKLDVGRLKLMHYIFIDGNTAYQSIQYGRRHAVFSN